MTTLGLEWEVKHAAINIAASADLVAAVSAKKIRLLSLVGMLAGTSAVKLQSGASTDLTGVFDHPNDIMFIWPYNPDGWCETVAGEKLNIVMGGGSPFCDGCLTYAEVT